MKKIFKIFIPFFIYSAVSSAIMVFIFSFDRWSGTIFHDIGWDFGGILFTGMVFGGYVMYNQLTQNEKL